jgi:hypothetical protein
LAKKPMMGPKLKRLRRDQGMTQARMAERLGISPSYLNLMENNQRPVTVPLLLKIGQAFDVDLQSFAADDDARLVTALQEVFGDPLFGTAEVARDDLVALAGDAPAAARGMLTLYRAFCDLREARELAAGEPSDAAAGEPQSGGSALDAIRDLFDENLNFFPELEAAAEEIWQAGQLEFGNLYQGLSDYLDRALGVRVRLMPIDVMGSMRRRYDRHGRRVLLSEMLPMSGRTFQLALQVALLKHGPLLDRLADDAGPVGEDARSLARMGLANYLAGAVMMPYDRFYRAAVAVRYDLEILQHRFAASLEQVCHRLTTLQRPGAKGVPFFLIRVDKAGNVSKRFSANRLHFARFGGACPRWNVHDAFRWPGRLHTQVSEMPDGQRYFSVAAMVSKAGAGYRAPGQVYAIALGCEIDHAPQLVYADGVDLLSDGIAVPIGLHCRLCDRPDCTQRAFPPAHQPLSLDESQRGPTAYAFGSGR